MLAKLNEAQTALARQKLTQYRSAQGDPATGATVAQAKAQFDDRRRDPTAKKVGPEAAAFPAGTMPLSEFKSEVDGLNKTSELWGFGGFKVVCSSVFSSRSHLMRRSRVRFWRELTVTIRMTNDDEANRNIEDAIQ